MENTESENLNVVRTNKERIMLSSKCAFCNSKKSKFIRKQEAERLFSIIGEILVLGEIVI